MITDVRAIVIVDTVTIACSHIQIQSVKQRVNGLYRGGHNGN